MSNFDSIRSQLGSSQPTNEGDFFKRGEAEPIVQPVIPEGTVETEAVAQVAKQEQEAQETVVKNGNIGGKLIFMDDVRKALAIGVVAEKNIVLWGVGGHAKSEILVDVQKAWNGQGDVWIQSLNANSNVPDLLGGFSPEHIKDFRFDRPRIEESAFAKAKVIVFEEAFDAAPRVITAMKDILTAKGWRHGEEFVPMISRSVVLVSNHDPEDVRKINPSVDALIQRFPLVINVMWDTYTETDFHTMLEVLAGREENPDTFELPAYDELLKVKPVEFTPADSALLSFFLSAATEERAKISPRTAVYCRDVLCAWAAIEGDTSIKEDHYEILRLVGDVAPYYDKAMERAKYYMKTSEDRNFMRNIKGRFTRIKNEADELVDKFNNGNIVEDDRDRALELAKRTASIKADISTRQWQDDTFDDYKDIDSELDDYGSKLLQAAGIKA